MLYASKKLFPLVALFCFSTVISASLSASPLDASVERAKFIVHLKVVGMERSKVVAEKFDDGTVRYEDDWAVCEVKQIVLGMVATDTDGRLRVTSASEKSTAELDNPVRYKAGQEFTIIADSSLLDNKVGMVLPGNAQRIDGEPSAELLKRLDDRIRRAESVRDELAKLLPKAQAEVETALKEFDDQARDDFKDLSPEADLLFDFCALAQYTPDLADFPRPALSDSDRKRLTLLALRGVCDINEEVAAIAAELVEGQGNGIAQLLKPADIEEGKALEALRRLSTREKLEPVLGRLLRHDADNRAASWAAALVFGNDATSKICEWALVECAEEGFFSREALTALVTPKGGKALSHALDKNALTLAGWLMLSQPDAATGETVLGAGIDDAQKKQLQGMYTRVELLQVYAYVLGMRGADDTGVATVRAGLTGKVQARGELDLEDVQDIARELRYKDKLPAAVKRVISRDGPEMR